MKHQNYAGVTKMNHKNTYMKYKNKLEAPKLRAYIHDAQKRIRKWCIKTACVDTWRTKNARIYVHEVQKKMFFVLHVYTRAVFALRTATNLILCSHLSVIQCGCMYVTYAQTGVAACTLAKRKKLRHDSFICVLMWLHACVPYALFVFMYVTNTQFWLCVLILIESKDEINGGLIRLYVCALRAGGGGGMFSRDGGGGVWFVGSSHWVELDGAASQGRLAVGCWYSAGGNIHIYVYIYICIYIHMYVYIYVYIYICIHIYTYVYTRWSCIPRLFRRRALIFRRGKHTYVCIYDVYICIYTYIPQEEIHTYIYVCIYIYIYMHILMYICIHICTYVMELHLDSLAVGRWHSSGGNTHTYLYIYIYIYIQVCIYI